MPPRTTLDDLLRRVREGGGPECCPSPETSVTNAGCRASARTGSTRTPSIWQRRVADVGGARPQRERSLSRVSDGLPSPPGGGGAPHGTDRDGEAALLDDGPRAGKRSSDVGDGRTRSAGGAAGMGVAYRIPENAFRAIREGTAGQRDATAFLLRRCQEHTGRAIGSERTQGTGHATAADAAVPGPPGQDDDNEAALTGGAAWRAISHDDAPYYSLIHPTNAARLRHATRKQRDAAATAHAPSARALAPEVYGLRAARSTSPFPHDRRYEVAVPRVRVHQPPAAGTASGPSGGPPAAATAALSLQHRDALMRVVEYIERRPPLRCRLGMGAGMCRYTKDAMPEDVYTGGGGGAAPAADIHVMHTSLFHAQLFPHRAQRGDFLLVKHKVGDATAAGGRRIVFTLQRLPRAVLLAGHVQPRRQLPAPSRADFAQALQRRISDYFLRLAASQPRLTLPADCMDLFEGGGIVARRRRKVAESILRGGYVRDEGNDGRYTKRDGDDAAAAATAMTPEMVCEIEGVEEGNRRLEALGIKDYTTERLERLMAIRKETALPAGLRRLLAAVDMADALTPWAQTRAFIECVTKGRTKRPPMLDLARSVLSVEELRGYRLLGQHAQAATGALTTPPPKLSDTEVLHSVFTAADLKNMSTREKAERAQEIRAQQQQQPQQEGDSGGGGGDGGGNGDNAPPRTYAEYLPVLFAREAATLAQSRALAPIATQSALLDDADDDDDDTDVFKMHNAANNHPLFMAQLTQGTDTQRANNAFTVTVEDAEGGGGATPHVIDAARHQLWQAYAHRYGEAAPGAGALAAAAADAGPAKAQGRRKTKAGGGPAAKRRKKRGD